MNHVKMLLTATVLMAVSLAMSACGTTSTSGGGTTTTKPIVTLAQAQNAATILLADIKADVTTYEGNNPSLDATTKADLDQSVSDLTSAVAQFTALPAGANYLVAANAVLNVANTVVGNLPASVLSANTKTEVQAGIGLIQAILALIPAPAPTPAAPPATPATGTVTAGNQ